MRSISTMMIACLSIVLSSGRLSADEPVDLLLKGGTIIDGSGGEPFVGDVAVRGEQIVAVGNIEGLEARRTIDCTGLVIAPGFIDLHNHSDGPITARKTRDALCYLTQGCTTIVTGNCGGGRRDVGKYYDEIAAKGAGANVAHLIPHGALRDHVMGKVRRAPTEDELRQMCELAEAGMREGAWGMSTGLIYVPGAYAQTDELVAIASVVGRHGGIYASHMRDEADQLLEAIEEVFEIARRANIHGHISHLKASKERNWGKLRAAAHLVERAHREGLRITADQYPYTASSTSIAAMLLPNAEREGGDDQMAARLSDPAELARLRPMVAEELDQRKRLMIASFRKKPEWVGKTIHEVAAEEGRDPVDVALEILRAGRAGGVNFGMDEADVRFAMTLPWVATASDGSSKVEDGTKPHPRSFGTFPRKIGRYSIREGVLPLPAAIRSASGLPADILGLTDRGYLRADLVADIVVFDPDELLDLATYESPFEMSAGVRWVLVNGQLAIDDGKPQNVLAGRPLRRNAEPIGGE